MVAFALGGVSVYRLAVAHEGAEAWRTDIRNGRMCTGLWGLCEKADLVLPRQFLRWLMNEGSGVRHFAPIFAPFRKVPPAPARV